VVCLPRPIKGAQFARSFDVLSGHGFDQILHLRLEIMAIAVEAVKEAVNGEEIGTQTSKKVA
jgi:hypothetical protein